MESQLILQKRLEKAQQDNETLLRLVGKVCAIIITQGGEVCVENTLIEKGEQMAWDVVNDGQKTKFRAWIRDDMDAKGNSNQNT